MGTFCYICGRPFDPNELAIPIQINMNLPYGMINILVVQHYTCGLEMYIEGLRDNKKIIDKDRAIIEGKLMEMIGVLSSSGGTKQ